MRSSRETKEEKFRRLAEARVNKILHLLRLLGNLSWTGTYAYTREQVEQIFTALQSELIKAKLRFLQEQESSKKRFSLSKPYDTEDPKPKNTPIYSRKTTDEVVDEAVYSAIADGNIVDTSSYVLRSGTVPTTGWVVYYYVDSQMITGQLQSILLRTLQVVAAVIAIAFVVITLFSRSLSKRILLLKASAERVASGDLDTVIETNDTDEIGIVINSFGAMTKRLNHLINEIYKMQLEKKAVELKALQAQINPHFLYNALSSINWKAIRQGNDDISQLTSTLATFYRTSLNNGESITSVENELANIRAYVEIQRHMRDFPFCVDYEIEEGVQKLSMLNFLLQPIVENAFKHGIDYTDETQNGRLLITCHTDGEFLVFTVRNNGPQIQEEKARRSLKQPGKGYGLFNIQERIALYYGDGCGLSAGLDENGYTCFTVKIKKSCTIDR